MNDQDDIEQMIESLHTPMNMEEEHTQLWVVSYSDFMTILMIFFLMLFAHRVWIKKTTWEEDRFQQLRAAQEAQNGMVARLAKLADLDVKAERIDIHLPSALLFESGHTDLSPSAETLLTKLAPELAGFDGQIVVEGHTDDLSPGTHSRYASNWEISVARSFSVIRCLTQNGVSPGHISARGYGPYRPRVRNDSPAHRAENRRIEIVLLRIPDSSRPILKETP